MPLLPKRAKGYTKLQGFRVSALLLRLPHDATTPERAKGYGTLRLPIAPMRGKMLSGVCESVIEGVRKIQDDVHNIRSAVIRRHNKHEAESIDADSVCASESQRQDMKRAASFSVTCHRI